MPGAKRFSCLKCDHGVSHGGNTWNQSRQLALVLAMEKSKSFPQYSSSFSGEFGFEDRSNSYNFNGPCQKGNGFATSSDPELKRKKRIASYNVFTMEGKLKSNVRNSFKWIKSKFSDVRYGM
ncbi:hypothetical protein POTOM_019731 [Populus tomentosa]|nr:hypothetical protein POTOM_019731 [Populus tomentosa]